MRVEWFGQSAFSLTGSETTVVIDPFGDLSGMASRGISFDYPAIEPLEAALLLVTHEHADHNGVEVVTGEPLVLRSTAGTLASPVGEVTAIASEHDEQAGTARGPNTIFVFELDGHRVCHMGDFGQSALRPEQAAAMSNLDLLFVPVGGGPTIGADGAAEIVGELAPRWVVPMHYRTPRISFLETAEDFLARVQPSHVLEEPSFDTDALPTSDAPLVVVPAAP